MNYYVSAVLKVFQGNPLDAHDKYSFDLAPILFEEDWNNLLNKTWDDAENLASLIDNYPGVNFRMILQTENMGITIGIF